MTLALICLAMWLLSLIAFAVLARSGAWVHAVFGLYFSSVYLLDLANIALTGQSCLTISLGCNEVPAAEIVRASWLVALTVVLFFFLSIAVAAVKRTSQWPSAQDTDVPRPMNSWGSIVFISLGVCVALLLTQAVVKQGIAETLLLRQQLFADSFELLLLYFICPVMVVLGYVKCGFLRGLPRAFVIVTALFCLVAGFLTGSRSGVLLSAVIPVVVLFILKAHLQRGRRRVAKRVGVVVAVAFPALMVLNNWYLTSFRGLPYSGGLMDGPDVTQADVLVSLLDAPNLERKWSYLAGLVAAIPRGMWPSKPYPGNVEVSNTLAPDRYSATGAEITAGLMGEGFVNLGPWAFVSAAIVLFVYALLASHFLSDPRDTIRFSLGLVLLLRGVNLVRGDLVNVMTPSLIAILLWCLIFGIRRTLKSRDPQPWVNANGFLSRRTNLNARHRVP